MGPNLFARNENSAYVMPCVTACGVTSCAHRSAHAHRQAIYKTIPLKVFYINKKLNLVAYIISISINKSNIFFI